MHSIVKGRKRVYIRQRDPRTTETSFNLDSCGNRSEYNVVPLDVCGGVGLGHAAAAAASVFHHAATAAAAASHCDQDCASVTSKTGI